jgi:Family of unknown function (DUF6464)
MGWSSLWQTVLIFALGFTPPTLAFLFIRRAEKRAQARLRSAMAAAERRQLQRFQLPTEHQYVEGIGYCIGDFTCRYNARSAQLRCAVNPAGPCQSCSSYAPITIADSP